MKSSSIPLADAIPATDPAPMPMPIPMSVIRPLPVQSNSLSDELDENQRKQLQLQGYSNGLCSALAESIKSFPLRFWVIDNRLVHFILRFFLRSLDVSIDLFLSLSELSRRTLYEVDL